MLQKKTNSKPNWLSKAVCLLLVAPVLWSGLHIYPMLSSSEYSREGVPAWNLSLVAAGKEIYRMAL